MAKDCTSCKFFKPHEPNPPLLPGECRRFPPMQHHHDTKYSYAVVDQNAWCGEFKKAT